jgi:N6-L-threonylcarbamoyladenine synthase
MTKLILGIETSCDDTSVALVDQRGNVAAIETVSQYEIHSEFGGVYPELASRAHLEAILPVIKKVMTTAQVTPSDLRAIGVTRGPGLMGSLLVGLSTAQALGMAWDVPTYGVNHLRGHIRSVDLEEKRLSYPALVLLVSGGHTLLAFLQDQNSCELLGTTRDDSVGECYDKVARTLGLGMPGGPAIDRMAAAGTSRIKFPRPMIKSGYEFSFSGLKSSVARYVETHAEFDVNDVAAAFVDACLDVLATKVLRAIENKQPATLAVVGGVAASPQVRARMQMITDEAGISLCLPPQKWATDNAAMIAMASWDYIEQGLEADLEPKPNLRLGEA